MNHSTTLNQIQLQKIRKLAMEKRRILGFIGETPIANDIFTILDNIGILLLEHPIQPSHEESTFSAVLMYSTEGDQELAFIGLNTADFFDKQIFAIAHELYHYYIKTGSHLSRPSKENNIIEIEANRFAAEFLLPENILEGIILDEFKTTCLHHLQIRTLLRFIARLQCTWWLPYHSLVKRLQEVGAISEQQYNQLYAIDERNMDG